MSLSDERIDQMTRQIFHHAPPAAKVFLAPVISRALREAATEATAAFKARVRAQAVFALNRTTDDPWMGCRLCGEYWREGEHHVPVDGQPCAAEVEP